MVIQRNFKTLNDYHISGHIFQQSRNLNTENSNSVNQNQNFSSTGPLLSQQSDTKNFVTTMEMASDVLTILKKRYLEVESSVGGIKTSNNTDIVLKALELLRINVQKAFDKEVDDIVTKYLNLYFQPAFDKIKQNLNSNYGKEEVLDTIKCALIENSKLQYNLKTDPSGNILLVTTQDIKGNQSRSQKQLTSASKTDIITQTKANNSGNLAKSGVLKRSIVAASEDIISIPTKKSVIVQKNTLTPSNTMSQKITAQRRQIYWHTANISTQTYFVLDIQANRAFGFSPDGRERLASKHPELIRYLPDSQDRDWLVQQKIIPSQNRTSRFLLLVYDEVLKLGNSDLYKCRANFNLQVLQPFTIPCFTIQKMKTFFIDLNIKSRGLITNSYTSNLLNIRAVTDPTNLPETISLSSTNIKINSNSQLRNALLQTNQRTQTERKTDSATDVNGLASLENQLLVSDSTSISSTAGETNDESGKKNHTLLAIKLPNQVVNSVFKSKDKSILSSSHATLTALLTNNNYSKNDNYNNYKNHERLQPKQK